jgi:GT2 family glycosyltransferase
VPRNSEIVIICAHYREPDQTRRFVERALDQIVPSQLHIIVVDNSSAPASQAVPASVRTRPHTRVLDPGRNSGYFGAASFALTDHLETNPLPEWLMVSNPDIRFTDTRVIQRLCDIHRGREPAVLAPSIRSAITGIDQNPHMLTRPSAARMRLYRWIFSAYPTSVAYQMLSGLKGRLLMDRRSEKKTSTLPEAIYAPHGSFIAFHKSYFERGGSLNYGAFLFGEEIFVAETARRLGLTVLYEPRLRLVHQEHTSTGGVWNRAAAHYRKESSRFLVDSYF